MIAIIMQFIGCATLIGVGVWMAYGGLQITRFAALMTGEACWEGFVLLIAGLALLCGGFYGLPLTITFGG